MRINTVQVLRAVAAIFVVFGHAMATAQRIGPFDRPLIPTGAGVDLFFAISGFIMVYSSENMFGKIGVRWKFLIRRILRVAPLYWISTTLYLALLLVAFTQGKQLPSVVAILCSYLFIPNADYGMVANVPFPILSLGWSLNYEMFFYFIFSIFIVFPREAAVFCVVIVLGAAVLIGLLFEPINVVVETWTQPIILEFAFGLLIGLAYRRGLLVPNSVRVAAVVFAVMLLAFDVGQLSHLAQTPNDFRRALGWGVPTALILAASVLGADPLPLSFEKAAGALGDASYSLYLTHPFVFLLLQRVWAKVFGVHLLWIMITIGLIFAVSLSIAINKMIERPLIMRLQRRQPLVV